MQSKGSVKHFVLAFLVALIGYALFYQGIERWRVRKGPWQVTFTRDAEHRPVIRIDQPNLAITNVQIIFAVGDLTATNTPPTAPSDPTRVDASATNSQTSATILLFAKPRPVPYDVPFGTCVFLDLISLPGNVTFELFGHEIQLLPRVLMIDRQEHPWQPDATITLPSVPNPTTTSGRLHKLDPHPLAQSTSHATNGGEPHILGVILQPRDGRLLGVRNAG
jgi:hypothetical protein